MPLHPRCPQVLTIAGLLAQPGAAAAPSPPPAVPASATAPDPSLGEDLYSILRDQFLVERRAGGHPGSSLAATGRRFLGRPYLAGSLDAGGPDERLVCRYDGFDCLTFVENCMAIMHALRADDHTTYPLHLEKIRYRAGKRAGYASRLHYFTEWIQDNAARGLVVDLTAELGGVPDTRPIHFMTSHREAYPALADDRTFQAIRHDEARLTRTRRFTIPKEKVGSMLAKLETGDIIAMTSTVEGLDVSHVGLVHRNPRGEVHLLHASRSGGAVQITALSLVDYLMANPSMSGIKVARPR